MKRIKSCIQIVIIILSLMACEIVENEGYKDFPATETGTIDLSGDWYVRIYTADGTPVTNYNLLTTSNTADDTNNDLWINDHEYIHTKVQANLSDLSFSGSPNADELIEGGTVTISNGKILRDQGRSTTNRVTDSIYFEAEFDSDGTILLFAGYKRTGFLEDEH